MHFVLLQTFQIEIANIAPGDAVTFVSSGTFGGQQYLIWYPFWIFDLFEIRRYLWEAIQCKAAQFCREKVFYALESNKQPINQLKLKRQQKVFSLQISLTKLSFVEIHDVNIFIFYPPVYVDCNMCNVMQYENLMSYRWGRHDFVRDKLMKINASVSFRIEGHLDVSMAMIFVGLPMHISVVKVFEFYF